MAKDRIFNFSINRYSVCMALSALFAIGLKADRFVWLGDKNSDPVFTVDWQDASLWTNLTKSVGNVLPGDEDMVEFQCYPPYSSEYDVTPPASFKGTIVGEKSEAAYARWFYPRISLRTAADSQYKIDGSATFVANSHLTDRIADTFAGVIEIPDGVVFEVPSSISKDVEFVGAGTVVPANAKQLRQVMGMTGPVDLRKLGDLDLPDIAPLMGHDLILPENAVLDTDGMSRMIVDIEDWNESGCWGFKGEHSEVEYASANYKAYAHEPQVLEDGTLLMTDDFGQRNVAWFKKRKFGHDDIWRIRFSYQAMHPKDGHPMELPSGTYARSAYGRFFGVVVSGLEEGIALPASFDGVPGASYGIRFYSYGNKPNVARVLNGGGSNVSDPYTSAILDSRVGISQRTAPVDLDVSMCRGKMFITYSQGGKSRSFTVDCSGIFKNDISKKYTLGFFANTVNGAWQHTRISNFRGWCLSADAGQWKEVESCRITPDNWVLNAYSDGMAEENRVAPADQILENGDFKFLKAKVKYLSSATCKTRLDPTRKYRIEYDLKWGSIANRGNVMGMGFVNAHSVETNATIGSYQVNTKYSPAILSYHYYNDLIGFTHGGNTDNGSKFPYEYVSASGLKSRNHMARCAIDYDGVDTLVGSFVSSTSVNHRVDIATKYNQVFSSRFPDGMYFHCGGANGTSDSWKCYLETDVCGFKVLEWNSSATDQKWQGGIRVPVDQDVKLSLGDVSIESVLLEEKAKLTIDAARETASVVIGSATVKPGASLSADEGVEVEVGGLSLLGAAPYALPVGGKVAFAESSSVTIPASWKRSLAPFAIMTFGSEVPTKPLSVVLDDGKVLDSRQVFIVDNEVRVNLHLGTCIVVR